MSGPRAFLGISHSPLLGLNPVPVPVERELKAAIAEASRLAQQWRAERIVLIGPDHYNGFFNELMPPFCVGTAAQAVGDYLTPSGPMHVDADTALALVDHLMEDFDIALSRRMQVDHGFAQALQLLWGGLDTPPVVPIFMNSVAPPGVPRLARCHRLGQSIGSFLDGLPGRSLLIGSGGLSHEPPVPTLAHPDAEVRERITVRHTPTQAQRDAKTERVKAAGLALAAGDRSIKPLNPAWDRRWMDALEHGDFGALLALDDASIDVEAGASAHESKTWLIGRSAVGAEAPQPRCRLRHYQAIPELIAGFGLLWLDTDD
jgi:2,3-dihydroxyphenylpropionate 1,2-dioxygenase